jgi:hypothetical protein
MALTNTEIRRLGRAAGENTATGASQRIDQATANFMDRNGATQGEADEFREEAEQALLMATMKRYKFRAPA